MVIAVIWIHHNTLIGAFLFPGASSTIRPFHVPLLRTAMRMKITLPVVTNTAIDYSAANEYVRSHYNVSKYFKNTESIENIYDGRCLQSLYKDEREMLAENGIALVTSPTSCHNWNKVKDIQESYVPELEQILSSLVPSKVLMSCFWNPMVRGESHDISRDQDRTRTPTSNIAAMAHIDTDVGAYESINDLLRIIEKNEVHIPNNEKINEHRRKPFVDAIIRDKKRFAILNFWRNIEDTPIGRAPLAILSTRYDNSEPTSFPDDSPDMNESNWFIFPNATNEEVIVFYQYDRDVSQPSDLWHCAIPTHEKQNDGYEKGPLRRSFDVRALIVFNETVQPELDRFTPIRSRPKLSFEESECFCEEQAARRNLS
jgi:hypothetical protein